MFSQSPDMLGSGWFLFSSSERKITLCSLSLFAQLYSLHFLPRQHLLGNAAGEATMCGAEPHFDGWRRRSPICTVAAGEVGTVMHIIPPRPCQAQSLCGTRRARLLVLTSISPEWCWRSVMNRWPYLFLIGLVILLRKCYSEWTTGLGLDYVVKEDAWLVQVELMKDPAYCMLHRWCHDVPFWSI